MTRRGAGEQQFPVVRRGYDREQVDGYLAAHARWGAEAWVRVQQLEAEVSELKDLVETLRHEREEAGFFGTHGQGDEIEAQARASEIVEAAEARSAELAEASRRDRQEACEIVERAQADVAEAERRASEIVRAAEARAAELSEEARRQRDEAARSDADPRPDVTRFLDQVEERMRRPDQGLPSSSDQPPR
jgi:cell division septum initiation protein DivIVA